ncbi:uncharacterized protein TrAFT101_001398 [Trichoderma asperellum]|uniref:uncharacterized protein n=1 Tax=Trichoderma asperellum TaxID=101201 RepID=UPI00332C606B|nr:hypothetical protein TrAFT101_001398 [Trichoderma asperellum]
MNLDEPYICIPGVPNFRDIGGYAITSEKNKQVRRNVIFRSAFPRQILDPKSGRAKNKIQLFNISHVFDLRSENEFLKSRVYDRRRWLWSATFRVSAPVFRPEDYNPHTLACQFKESGSGPEGFVQIFDKILESASHPENKARPFAQILELLSSKTNKPPAQPILIHCDLGTDRTAVICALILSLCGVSDLDVAKDYHQSGIELASHLKCNAVKLEEDPVFKSAGGTAADAKILVSTREDSMLCFLKYLREKHGSIKQCIKNHKLLDDDGISRLRKNMIVDAAKNHSIARAWDR